MIAQTEPSLEKPLKTREDSRPSEPPSAIALAPQPVQILGGVEKPANIPYREGADLPFYLARAGAPASQESQTTKIQIIRGEPGKKTAQEFNLSSRNYPAIQSGDIVIVHSPKKPILEKAFTVVASAAAILGTAALLILAV